MCSSDLAEFYSHVLLNTKGGHEALDYLKNRGYTVETLKEFGFGFSLKDRTQLEQVLQELQLTDVEKEASTPTWPSSRSSAWAMSSA